MAKKASEKDKTIAIKTEAHDLFTNQPKKEN